MFVGRLPIRRSTSAWNSWKNIVTIRSVAPSPLTSPSATRPRFPPRRPAGRIGPGGSWPSGRGPPEPSISATWFQSIEPSLPERARNAWLLLTTTSTSRVPSPSRSLAGSAKAKFQRLGPIRRSQRAGSCPARGDSGIRGIPDDLAGRAVATDDGLAGELHDVGLAGRQLEGRRSISAKGIGCSRGLSCNMPPRAVQLPPEQAALVERDLVIDRLAAIDGQAIGPAEPAFSVNPEPVVAGRQGQRRLFEHLDRLAERILARLVEDLHREHRPLVDQLDSPEAPRRIAPPGTPAGEIEQHRGGEDPCRGAEHPAIRAGGSWRWFHCRTRGRSRCPGRGPSRSPQPSVRPPQRPRDQHQQPGGIRARHDDEIPVRPAIVLDRWHGAAIVPQPGGGDEGGGRRHQPDEREGPSTSGGPGSRRPGPRKSRSGHRRAWPRPTQPSSYS